VLSAGAGGGYELTLDSKKLKTPNGFVFSVDSEPLALAVAHEWKTQQEYIMLSQMHLTGLCNICIDNPTQTTKYALVDSALNFLDTDTILYFSHVS
jgi:ATP synthase F1 complex assembly factor 2